MRLIAALLLSAGCVIHVPARTQYVQPPVAATRAQPPAPPPYAPLSEGERAYVAAPAPLATPQTFSFACAHGTPGGGYCPVLVPHEHPYPPEGSAANDDCAGVADGFRYEGVHPAPGGGWCEISLLHLHDFAPLVGVAWVSRAPGVYVYGGPPRGAAGGVAPATQAGPVAVEPVGSDSTPGAVKAFKAIGRVGEAVGKGAASFLKGVDEASADRHAREHDRYKRSEMPTSTHHNGGYGGGHGGHH